MNPRREPPRTSEEPTFAEPLHVGRPNIASRQRFLERMETILDRRWLTNSGPFVQEFEEEICGYLGVRHCISVCNATIGLQIAARSMGLTGEVIVPSFTFVATAHALEWLGLTPVFCEVDPETHNIDDRKIEELLTPKTSGILAVHVWGRPCNVEALEELANRHGLQLFFDAAHAFGCSHRGKMIGGFGRAEVFSFHATKFLNSFEGGAITTDDDQLAETLRLMRNFGFTGYDEVGALGTNGKMAEPSAAMGLTNLEGIDALIATNRENYRAYEACLAAIPCIELIEYDGGERCNYQYVIAEVDQEQAGISRDQLAEELHRANVLARRYFYPGCHRMEPYRSRGVWRLPVTEGLSKRVLALPTGTAVSTADVEKICAILAWRLS